jgi:hypothetical protein
VPTYLSLAQQRLWLSEQPVLLTASSRGCTAGNAAMVGLPLGSYAHSDLGRPIWEWALPSPNVSEDLERRLQ